MHNFKLRAAVAALAGVALLGLGSIAQADSTDDLLKKLRDKGVLTEQEFDEFNSTRDTEKAKKTSEIKASFKDGISWESGDKQHKISLNGRVQADYRSFDEEDTNNQAGTWDIRRAYFGAKGTFFNTYDFEVTTNNGAMLYAWLNARYWEGAQFKFGQFKQPMGLEELGSSRFINFSERSFVSQLVPAVDRGAQLHGTPTAGVTYAVGMFNGVGTINAAGANATDNNIVNDGKTYTGRVTANIAEMMGNKEAVYHLGAAYSKSRENDLTTTGQSILRSEGRGTNLLTMSSTLNAGYDIKRTGLEAAVAYGPFKFQSEYLKAQFEPGSGTTQFVTGGSAGDKDIKAWYASVNWLITGENYASTYKNGVFGDRIRPKNEFVAPGAPGLGAWDIGVRYSKFDASDFRAADTADVYNAAGENAEFNEAKSWTLGLKWIPNANVRYVLNYVKTDMDCQTGFTCTNDEEKALNFRAQFDF